MKPKINLEQGKKSLKEIMFEKNIKEVFEQPDQIDFLSKDVFQMLDQSSSGLKNLSLEFGTKTTPV